MRAIRGSRPDRGRSLSFLVQRGGRAGHGDDYRPRSRVVAGSELAWPPVINSVVQLAEGREGVYGGGHPPVMSWLLGITDRMRPGAALFVVFDTVLIAGALVSFVLAGPRVLMVGAPHCRSQRGDAAASYLSVDCVEGCAVRRFGHGWLRLCGSRGVVLGGPSEAHRLAGDGVAVAGARRLGPAEWRCCPSVRRGGCGLDRGRMRSDGKGRGWAYGLAFLGASALVVAGAATALNARVEGPPSLTGQFQALQTWDIVSAVTLEPHTDLTVLRSRARWLEQLLRTDGVAAYSPIRADTLEPVRDRMVGPPESAALIVGQWEDIILRHPLLYLRVRARAFNLILLTPNAKDCVLVYTGVDGPRDEMQRVGLVRRRTGRDRALANYALGFCVEPGLLARRLWRPGFVLLIGLMFRRRPADIACGRHARQRHHLRAVLRGDFDLVQPSLPVRPRFVGNRGGPLCERNLEGRRRRIRAGQPVRAVSRQLVSPLAWRAMTACGRKRMPGGAASLTADGRSQRARTVCRSGSRSQ